MNRRSFAFGCLNYTIDKIQLSPIYVIKIYALPNCEVAFFNKS
jgi:hypothetical protein